MVKSGTLTLLFVDIVGSTALVAALGDERAAEVLAAHRDELSELVTDDGGVVVKWTGDGLVATFTSVAGALRVAHGMHAASSSPRGGDPYELRVGVHAGEVSRDGDDVVGLPVVIASRLCDWAGAAETLVSSAAAGLVAARGDFTFGGEESAILKGVPEPVGVRLLLDVEHTPSDDSRAADAPRSSLRPRTAGVPIRRVRCPVTVGRRVESARVGSIIDADDAGVSTVLVTGEAGIGKSRLVEETVGRAKQEGWVVRRGDCFEPDRSLPFGPFLDLLLGDDSLTEIAARLEEMSTGTAGNEELDRRRALDALSGVLGRGEPVLVVLEDLHWADEVSLEAIVHLARRAPRTGGRLLATFRHDEVSSGLEDLVAGLERLRTVEEVRLDRLGADGVAEMAGSILDQALPADRLARLVEVSDGVPFYVEQLVHDVVDDADLPRLPLSVDWSVKIRLEAMQPADRQALLRAAVIGRDVDVALLGALIGWDGASVSQHLAALLASGLVTERGPQELRFVHELARQAVVNHLLAAERVVIHRDIADLLSSRDSPSDRDRADLVRHAFEGHAWSLTIDHGLPAARAAAAQGAPAAAREHLDRVVGASQRLGRPAPLEALLLRASVLDTPSAEADLVQAADLASSMDDDEGRWRAVMQRVRLDAQHSHERARGTLDEALMLAERLDDQARIAETISLQGNLEVNQMRVDAGTVHLERAMDLASRADDDRVIAITGEQLMVAYTLAGDFVSARRHGEEAVRRLRRLGDSAGLVTALTTLGSTGGNHQGDTVRPSAPLASCAEEVAEALALARDIGWPAGEAFAARALGGIRSAQGRLAEGLDLVDGSVVLAESIEHPVHILRGLTVLGEIYMEIGDLDRARSQLERALEMARRSGFLAPAIVPITRLVTLDLAAGRIDDGEDSLEELQAPVSSMARMQDAALAEVLLARGDAEGALGVVERAVLGLTGRSLDDPPVRMALLRAAILQAADRMDEADAVLRGADVLSQRWGMTLLRWRGLAQRSRLRMRLGDREMARGLGDQCWELVAEAAAGLDDDLARVLQADVSARTPAGPSDAPKAGEGPSTLTRRETEVAVELARGRTNQEIAASLVISVNTAETHVKRILAKLGFRSRTQVAHWAHQQGLLEEH